MDIRPTQTGKSRPFITAGRTQWQPRGLQKVVDALADARLETLSDPTVVDVARCSANSQGERRIWLDLPIAARSLSVTAHTAKSGGWFDPIIVGASAFAGSEGQENRRKVWSLSAISQPWLRDILWEHLGDEALKPASKRGSAGLVYSRIAGISWSCPVYEYSASSQVSACSSTSRYGATAGYSRRTTPASASGVDGRLVRPVRWGESR